MCFLKCLVRKDFHIESVSNRRSVSNIMRVAFKKASYATVNLGWHGERTVGCDSHNYLEVILGCTLVVTVKNIIFGANE